MGEYAAGTWTVQIGELTGKRLRDAREYLRDAGGAEVGAGVYEVTVPDHASPARAKAGLPPYEAFALAKLAGLYAKVTPGSAPAGARLDAADDVSDWDRAPSRERGWGGDVNGNRAAARASARTELAEDMGDYSHYRR